MAVTLETMAVLCSGLTRVAAVDLIMHRVAASPVTATGEARLEMPLAGVRTGTKARWTLYRCVLCYMSRFTTDDCATPIQILSYPGQMMTAGP